MQKCSKLCLYSLESFKDSLYVRDIFSKGKASIKKANVLLLQSSRATKAPIGVWVNAAPFLHKIGTKRLGIFGVADYRSSLNGGWLTLMNRATKT